MGWVPIYNFASAAAAAAIRGGGSATGGRGQDANRWLSGAGAPLPPLGNPDDFYFQTDTSQVWKKVSPFFGVPPLWRVIAQLPARGPAGPAGPMGPPGLTGPPGPTGAAASGEVLIQERLLTVSTTTVTFSVPTTPYRHLHLIARGRMATNNSNNYKVMLRFNGDSGANYDWFCSGDNSSSYGDVNALVADWPLSTDLANHANPLELTIPYYRDTTWHKTLLGQSANQFGTTAGAIQAGVSYARWRSTAAITQIDFFCGGSSGQFAASTIFSLYGMA